MEFRMSTAVGASSAAHAVVPVAPSFSSNTNPDVVSKAAGGASLGSRSQRRSACDDCRARKVQCSGDVAGCQRCRRADIKCTYSAPKPPGRPRKVRKEEHRLSNNTTTTLLPPSNQTQSQSQFLSIPTISPAESSVTVPQLSYHSTQQDVGQHVDEFFGGMFENDMISCAGNGTMSHNLTSSFPIFGGFDGRSTNGFLFPGAPFCHSPMLQTSHPQVTTELNGAMTDHVFSWNPYNSLSLTPPLSVSSSLSPTCRLDSTETKLSPCSCLNTFLNVISSLQHPPPATTDFSLPLTLTTLRSAITAIGTSIHCRYCHSSVQSTFVCMMMLGTMIPLLILYIESALKSVAAISSGSNMIVAINGVEAEVTILIWKEMAHEAIRAEFLDLIGRIQEIEGILEKRHFGGKNGALRTIASSRSRQDLHRNKHVNGSSDNNSNQPADREEAGRLVGREIVNRDHETAEPPFCVGLLWMIQGMVERVKVLI